MIEVPYAKDHHENTERTRANRDGYMPCIVCGRAVNVTGRDHWMVYVHCGGSHIVDDKEYEYLEGEDPGAGLGGYPIGPDCLRQHPEIKPYAFRVRAMPKYQS